MAQRPKRVSAAPKAPVALDERGLALSASVSPDSPNVPTVTSVWRAADWFEREAHDLFGVVFDGQPNLAHLLLYQGFPGRKSFPFHDYDKW